MIKKVLLLSTLILAVQTIFSQEKFKFGTVPESLLQMTVYEKDTSANAIVVYEDCDIYYDWSISKNDFQRVTDYVVRLKVLRQAGVDYVANNSIAFIQGSISDATEQITGFQAFTYNLENGKVVKTKLEKQYVNIENVTQYYKRQKFAMPAVKVGSVVEYKYTLSSPFYSNSLYYKFQRSIPVLFSKFAITIPEYFIFNKETKGYETIKTEPSKKVNLNFNTQGANLQCIGETTTAYVSDLKALKNEDYVWNINDFLTGIKFELMRVSINTGMGRPYYKDYSQTWNAVAKILGESEMFGAELKKKNLLKNEATEIRNSGKSEEEKIVAVLNLVRQKIKWNKESSLSIDNVSKALKEGKGSSGEVNAALLIALQNAGFEAFPVVMSLRSAGRLPMTYPSINNLNYFVVRVATASKIIYLDATHDYCGINILPVNCLVEKAIVLYNDNFEWVDLTTIGNNAEQTNLIVNFNEDGFLSGQMTKFYIGECAFSFKDNYKEAKDENEFVQKKETKQNTVISNYKIDEKNDVKLSFTEHYDFISNEIQLGDYDYISFEPLLFEAMKTNPFKVETRDLPVEFNYPQSEKINVNINIPQGYIVEEIPQSAIYKYGDNKEIEFSFIAKQSEIGVQVSYRLDINISIIPATDYTALRDFMSKVFAKCQEVVILKKEQ